MAYATVVADEPGPNVRKATVTETAAAMPPPPPPPAKTRDLPARESVEGKRESKQHAKSDGDERYDSLDGSDSETERERERRRDWKKRIGRYRVPRAAESEREDRTRDRSARPGPCVSDTTEDEGSKVGSHRSRKKR